MDFINQHSGAFGGALGAVATTVGFIFKQWWDDRKDRRAFEAEEKTKERLLGMVQQSLDDRKAAELRNHEIQTRQFVVLENIAQSQRATNGKLDKILGMKSNNGMPHEA